VFCRFIFKPLFIKVFIFDNAGISRDVATTSEMALDKTNFLTLQNLILSENDENTFEHYQWVNVL
jgi:hypothetical protein